MTPFWSFVAWYAVRIAVWALCNPAKVNQGIADVHTLVDAVKAAKE